MDTYNKLEYNQIIQIIEKYCKTYIGKKLAFEMMPHFCFDEVNKLLSESMEALKLIYQKGTPPFTGLLEMEPYLKFLESNQILSTQALLAFATLLKSSRELKEYFKTENFETELLENYFSQLYINPSIEQEIYSKIIDENTIADNASAKLSSLRRNRKSLEQGIKEKLSSILHSTSYAKYLMEPVITIRNNRYVIPVKSEYRNMIQGFIHDISSSGSTVYIEPTSIFDANNQIASLKMEEEIEIEKILQNLSILLYDYTNELTNNLKIIGSLDLLFAKAHYAKDSNGIMPILNNKKEINLIKAKHPLIDSSSVVPIDISLGSEYNCLIITGPNTGGKTVALKTLGLLLLMAYSGIPIPCHEESSICVLDNIFVDVGDEQNIQESLSTFSSHILNIVEITKKVTSNSLVLVDELGSGTDPIEGANLAISILQFFSENSVLVACTTHYQELKEFALTTDGFENASFEFDVENLKPTYHLLLGIPGKSNAFEISKRLGLSNDIIERANSLVHQDHVSIEELLKSIYDDKLIIENQKEETRKNLVQIQNLRKSLEQDQSDLIQNQKLMIENAKSEARDILFSAKEEANQILQELNSESIDLRQANRLRNNLNDKIKELGQVEISKNSNGFKSLQKEQVKQGIEVWVSSLQTVGTILSKQPTKTGEVLVQVGLAKMNLKLDEIGLIEKSNASKNKVTGKVTTQQESKAKFVSPEINVIGQTVDDAVYVIDKYLDNCAISNMSPVRIVHGKGTGKLREGIHQYLKKNPHVKSYRLGTFGEGEMGVTVVELK